MPRFTFFESFFRLEAIREEADIAHMQSMLRRITAQQALPGCEDWVQQIECQHQQGQYVSWDRWNLDVEMAPDSDAMFALENINGRPRFVINAGVGNENAVLKTLGIELFKEGGIVELSPDCPGKILFKPEVTARLRDGFDIEFSPNGHPSSLKWVKFSALTDRNERAQCAEFPLPPGGFESSGLLDTLLSALRRLAVAVGRLLTCCLTRRPAESALSPENAMRQAANAGSSLFPNAKIDLASGSSPQHIPHLGAARTPAGGIK